MKKSIVYLVLILSILLNLSCQNSNAKKTIKPKSINYSDKTNLINLIKETPNSKDTIFLGFTIGMTKSEFKKHVKKIRNEGRTINFSESNRITTIAGVIELGAGYVFETNISTELGKKTLTGKGQYVLQPIYDKTNLMGLKILPIEKWNDYYGGNNPKWLSPKVFKNSNTFKNQSVRQAFVDNGIIKADDVIRQKNNLVIYEDSFTINYIDYKTLLTELLVKITEKTIIEEKNKEIKF